MITVLLLISLMFYGVDEADLVIMRLKRLGLDRQASNAYL